MLPVEHGSHANEGPAFTTFLTTHRQLHDLQSFTGLYDLGEQAEVGLEGLGFRFGDDLSTVTADEYAIAGFKPFGVEKGFEGIQEVETRQSLLIVFTTQ